MIKPTIGRVVWFHPGSGDMHFPPSGPFAALVVWVHSDELINVVAFNGNGVSAGRTSVKLIQEGQPAPSGPYCEWMPYQKGQAAKTEALEAKITG
jgi:hypothetical protein